MCEKVQCIVNSLHDDATEEDANKLLKCLKKHKATTSPIPNIDLSPKGTKPSKETIKIFRKGRMKYWLLNHVKTAIKPKAKNNIKDALNLYV